MIRYTSLSSSSTFGNAYLVEGSCGTRVLVDCGTRQQRLEVDLAAIGVDPSTLAAVMLTHEHSDHTYCLSLRRSFLVRYEIPVYAHADVWRSCPAAHNYLRRLGSEFTGFAKEHCLEPGRETVIGGLAIRPFATPHDAVRSLGFVFSDGHSRLGLATDLGHVTDEVGRNLQDCTHLILESNYDHELEINSGRPWYLIERVLGSLGHLSNAQASQALVDLVGAVTRTVLLAHLSIDCNRPDLALETVTAKLRRTGWRGMLAAAPAASPSGWIT